MAKKKVKKNPKVIYIKKRQTGKSDTKSDEYRKAMPPGKRRSSGGNIYYEFRKNRTDKPGSLTGMENILYNKDTFDKDREDLNRTAARLNYLEADIIQLQGDIKNQKIPSVKQTLKQKLANRKKQYNALKKYFNTIAKFR